MAGETPPKLRLVTRGDDAGSCYSANRAVLDACAHGLLKNVSIMVPGPAFEDAARLLSGLTDICLGLHVTLNAEWVGPKWGPVLPPEQVPSLVDEKGSFFPSPNILRDRDTSVDEMMAEVEAQLHRARSRGLTISYLDEHMGVGWVGGLRDRLADLARREGVQDAHPIPSLPEAAATGGGCLGHWMARLTQAPPGDYVLVTHPGYDDEEMQEFFTPGQAPGLVARERDAERRALINPQFASFCAEHEIELIRYTEARPA